MMKWMEDGREGRQSVLSGDKKKRKRRKIESIIIRIKERRMKNVGYREGMRIG